MDCRRTLICILAFVFSLSNLQGRIASAASSKEVEDAIAKAKAYLYSQQKDGTWDPPSRQPNERGEKLDWTQSWTNWGGSTAVITYALLASGESPNDERLKPAIEFLKKAELKGTYSIGVRSQVWAHLPNSPEIKNLIRRDADLLNASMMTKGPGRGLWGYTNHGAAGDATTFDHSNSQYGVLGLWGAADVGLEVPSNTWKIMDKAWRDNQHPDGSWSYKKITDPTKEFTEPRFTMTLAGIATLYLTNDYLNPGYGINCKGNIQDANIEKGLEWLGGHFDDLKKADNIIVGSFNYGLYGLERVGVASGRKYIGQVDWYEFGVGELLKLQSPEGAWRMENGPAVASTTTALGLLFLGYGHAPVTMNKLQWEFETTEDAKAKAAVPNWNERPRDAANFVRWMGKQLERPLNWQVVSLKFPVEHLHDAPIIYITGNQALKFSKEDEAKLKQYVEEGGLILGNADCANKEFADSFRKLGLKLFPSYEFRELPADHIIYTGEQFARSKWKTPPSVLGMSNGVRELMLLLPAADIGKSWQLSDSHSKAEAFQLGSNIVLYASENKNLLAKGDTYLVARDEKIPAGKAMKLARLEYAGNWNPEPAGWKRMANILHNSHGIELQTENVKLGDGKLDSTFKVAHFTGASPFKLTAGEQAELKKFLDGGGTLIVDAAGGSSAFAQSAEAMLAAMYPDAKSPYPNLSKDHPAFAKIDDPAIRKFAVKILGKSKPPMPRGIEHDGRVLIYYSPLDLSVAIVGQQIDGVAGYDPATAEKLISGILENISSHP